MITTPLSRLADLLKIEIARMNRSNAQNAVCEAASNTINDLRRENTALYELIADIRTASGDHGKRMQQELVEYIAELKAAAGKQPETLDSPVTDTDRLDYLDSLNKEFNERNNSNYGWEIDWNHNRIALHDSDPMRKSVREAIDEHRERFMSHQKTKEADHG